MNIMLPEIAQSDPYYLLLNVFTASKRSNFYISFAIIAAGVVPSPIVQIILFFGPLRSVRIFRVSNIVSLEPSSKQCFKYLTPFRQVPLIRVPVYHP